MVAMGPDRISQNADLFVLVVRSYTIPFRPPAGDDEQTVTTSLENLLDARSNVETSGRLEHTRLWREFSRCHGRIRFLLIDL